MAASTTAGDFAWMFDTDLVWRQDLKKRLDPISARPWILFDSDSREDDISSWLTPHASEERVL